ncbi:hypothetical protein J6590_093229 [Homalodisca vitripennis]|nr:hypothetical protein J6590_093229 [Homalodisca vitripennis]
MTNPEVKSFCKPQGIIFNIVDQSLTPPVAVTNCEVLIAGIYNQTAGNSTRERLHPGVGDSWSLIRLTGGCSRGKVYLIQRAKRQLSGLVQWTLPTIHVLIAQLQSQVNRRHHRLGIVANRHRFRDTYISRKSCNPAS